MPDEPTPKPAQRADPAGLAVVHVHPFRPRFHEVDSAKVVFFGRVFEYAHVACEMLLEAIGCPLPEDLDVHGWGVPIVHAEADYMRPMRLGERLEITVLREKVSRRAFTLVYDIHGAGTRKDLRARVRIVQAAADLKAFAPIELPAVLADGLRNRSWASP